MFLYIIGIAFVIIGTYFVYKNAQEYGRNGIVWGLITFLSGIGLQWFFPFVLVVIWMVFLIATGSTQMQAQATIISYTFIGFLLTVGGLLTSGFVVLLILKYVSRMPDEKTFNKPPTPPTFS